MSPTIYSCVLCGYIIDDYENPDSGSWMNQFRILCSRKNGIAVTGVGIYNDPYGGHWTAPSDFTARWDDTGYNFPTRDEISVLRQPPLDGPYGFPFHEACWSLLEKAYSPDPVPFKALFEVCRSLPVPSGGDTFSWGHDFGGLVFVDNQHRYPWEDRFKEQYGGDSAPCLAARIDPYHVPEIWQLSDEDPQTPPTSRVPGPAAIVGDSFVVFPLEIRIAIASYLPTVDALNTRRASRSFLPIFDSQQFWASRFKVHGDRSWLFELQELAKTQDWRWLYHRTNEMHRTRGMQNRERIWKLIQRAQGTLSLRWAESSVPSSPVPNAASVRWKKATGDLRPQTCTGPYIGFNEGCRVFREQHTSIPCLLSQIAFSIIQLGDAKYITGMRLIPSKGEAVQLGYRAEWGELFLDTTCLIGFNLAVGSRGIQGIQCLVDNRRASQWFGQPHEAPRTRRLAVCGPITAIKAGFDGCKMVSLAVAQSFPLPVDKAIEERKSLRDSALWYPEIPPINLHLNEDYFTSRDSSTTRYQPLCWTMFGGPGGIYLRSLVGISVTHYDMVLYGIEFRYDTENVPVECRKVGRYKSPKGVKVKHFPINGPEGEVINTIKIYLRNYVSENISWFYKQGALESFKISTNRGRSYDFRPKKSAAEGNIVEKLIVVTPGDTITGIYWSQHTNRLTAIGAISEVLKE